MKSDVVFILLAKDDGSLSRRSSIFDHSADGFNHDIEYSANSG